MRRWHWANSVVTRMVAGFCLGGVVLSIALAMIEYQRAMNSVTAAAGQQLTLTTHNLREVVRPLLGDAYRKTLEDVLRIFVQDPRITAARVVSPDGWNVSTGPWPDASTDIAHWTIDEQAIRAVGELDINRLTLLAAPFLNDGKTYQLELIVNGPYMRGQMRSTAVRSVATAWLLLAVLTLTGLLILRHWLTGPLQRLGELTTTHAPASAFEQASDEMVGEFGQLALALGRMLRHIDEITDTLRQREQAFAHLYQFAPSAMLSIGPDGRITDANRRAAELLKLIDEQALRGMAVLDFIAPRDRAAFRQAIDRLQLDRQHHCELQLLIDNQTRDVDVQLAGVLTHEQTLSQVRLALIDVTESRKLMRQVTEQRRLLDMVINHMSDAILLVGADHRILTVNRRLSELLNAHPQSLIGQPYDPAEFWASLRITDAATFNTRLRLAVDQPAARCQEQFDSDNGSFCFEAIPIADTADQPIAQLWVVQEVTAQVRNRRLMEQQDTQLRALQRIGRQLHDITGVDQLLHRTTLELLNVMDVEAVGVAVRYHDPKRRCRQLIHTGASQTPLSTGQPLANAIVTQLMPNVLSQRGTSFWADLPSAGKWTESLVAAGFDSLAATTLFCRDRAQGILWIARKGGERIDRYHIYLLEALAPMMSTALANAEMLDQLDELALIDPVTELPSYKRFEMTVASLARRRRPWAMLLIDIDRFRPINERIGVAASNQLLRQIGQIIESACRSSDRPMRYSEDKFAVICQQTDDNEVLYLAERIRANLAQSPLPAPDGDQTVQLTCSIGVASSRVDSSHPALMIQLAEQRLRTAKATGRNRVVHADAPAAAAG
ncbi:MAG: diguanylate cyclase [Phycisphaerales bacterium]